MSHRTIGGRHKTVLSAVGIVACGLALTLFGSGTATAAPAFTVVDSYTRDDEHEHPGPHRRRRVQRSGRRLGRHPDPGSDAGTADGTRVGDDTDGTRVGSDTDGTRVGSDTDGDTATGTDGTRVGADTDGTRVGSDTVGDTATGTDGTRVGSDTDGTRVGAETDGTRVG